jgi:hypothetical protein
MRIPQLASILLISTAYSVTALAQVPLSPEEILASAEAAYPEAGIPNLFAPGSSSEAFASEIDDPSWSADMEGRIRAEIEKEQEKGLVLRRADVQCRATTCAMLLVHAADRGEGSVGRLIASLRKDFGFAGVNQSLKEIPIQQREVTEDGVSVRTWFVKGHVEVLLMAARGTQSPVL